MTLGASVFSIMKLRTSQKIYFLALAVALCFVVMLIHDACLLRKCMVLSELQNVFNQAVGDMELQQVYLQELLLVKAAHGDDSELKAQIAESSMHIDAAFSQLADKGNVATLPGVASLSELWAPLKEHRSRVASGYDVQTNLGLANAAYVAFRQELRARHEELAHMHSDTIASVFRNSVRYVALALVLMVAICVVYWRGTIRPLQRLEALLALLNPQSVENQTLADCGRDFQGAQIRRGFAFEKSRGAA